MYTAFQDQKSTSFRTYSTGFLIFRLSQTLGNDDIPANINKTVMRILFSILMKSGTKKKNMAILSYI